MPKSKDYDKLSEQIGDFGGETGLGKLEHTAAIRGGKEALTPAEEDAKNAFLKKQRELADRADAAAERYGSGRVIGQEEETNISDGWIPIDRNEMHKRSIFYPETWEFYLRPATEQAIKNWMSIDEENLLQVNRVFNEICKFCIRIVDGDKSIAWGNINYWDRFWFITKVRECTFASNKKIITFDDTCAECDQEITFELRSDNLVYEFPDDELVEAYWNGSNWYIEPEEYDVEHDPITLYTPTLAKEEAIIDWARREHERGKKLDENFPKFALWLINKPSKDPDMFDKQIQKILKDYKNWSVDFYRFMEQVVTNITINPKETLRQVCPHCGEEVISTVKFPNGIKVLFDVETRAKRFGTK